MELSRDSLTELLDKLYDMSNIPSFEVYEEYSGRGMYGRACLGFVTENAVLLHGCITAALAEAERDCDHEGEDYEGPSWYDFKPATDSMGRADLILYYPGIQLEGK